MLNRFEYFKPKSTDDIIEIIKIFGESAEFLAGGTDLLLSIKRGEKKPSALIDISGITKFHNLEVKDGQLHIGSMITFATLASSPLVKKYAPALNEAAINMGSPQIRNMATIGGNISTASPAGDSLPALVAHNAFIVISIDNEINKLPIEDYLKLHQQWMKRKSIINEVVIPCGNYSVKGSFIKLGRRNSLSIARINAACVVKRDDYDVVREINLILGAVGDTPVKITEVDILKTSKIPSQDTFFQVADAATDVVRRSIPGRASLPYKERAVKGVVMELLDKVYYG